MCSGCSGYCYCCSRVLSLLLILLLGIGMCSWFVRNKESSESPFVKVSVRSLYGGFAIGSLRFPNVTQACIESVPSGVYQRAYFS